MSAFGEGSNVLNTVVVYPSSIVAGLSVAHSPLKLLLTCNVRLSEESRVPEDSFSLYALDSSFQGPNVRGAHSKSPLNIYLDVEPCLSHPQVDSHTAGFSENVSYASDLLQLFKLKGHYCELSQHE